MKVLAAGANGNTGTRIVRMLRDGPHDPLAMIRDPSQKRKFRDMKVAPVLGDLEKSLEQCVEECDAPRALMKACAPLKLLNFTHSCCRSIHN